MTLLGTFLLQVLDGKSLGENLTPANMFAVLSILGARTPPSPTSLWSRTHL